ncbi:MAG TPA: hypothetical protein VH369_09250, partial [Bryobacteraceae bacterium]
RDSGKRAELELAPVGHAGVAIHRLPGGGRGRNEEWVGESLFGERSRGWILRHAFLLLKNGAAEGSGYGSSEAPGCGVAGEERAGDEEQPNYGTGL